MDPFCAFFTSHLTEIYFLYGLAFFVTGIVVWLEASRSPTLPLTRTLPFLAAFGITHGVHEWMEMFARLASGEIGTPARILRLFVLIISFIPLVEFGLRLLTMYSRQRWRWVRWAMLAVFLGGLTIMWAYWNTDGTWIIVIDVWSRYSLAMPGAILSALGLFKHKSRTRHQPFGVSRDLTIVGLAFFLYGVPGQIFVTPSPLPPSNVVNSQLFMHYLHFPVQLLRTITAMLIALFVVRSVRLFQRQRQRQVDKLNQERLEAQRRLTEEMAEREALRREIFHQTVQAQEEERQHIARELHDEAGQALTAISYELAALEEALPPTNPEHHDAVRERTTTLRRLTENVLDNLQRLTNRLRPTMLDELGLVPALIAYTDECSERFPFNVDIDVTGPRRRLTPEIETTLYRIVQEGLTNVARHAEASHAWVKLHFDQHRVVLHILDDGVGIDLETIQDAAICGHGWGLAGICERVELLGGDLDIQSSPGEGANLCISIPTPRCEETEED
jgi:signal transduction histidine kinase